MIYSTSPKTGPNDSSTRVTIFGDGFQFPMQVFMTGGTCGAQRVEGVGLGHPADHDRLQDAGRDEQPSVS